MASLLSSGLGKVRHNKRYIIWFWLLNLTLAEFATAAFRRSAHAILDRSLFSDGAVKGLDLGVVIGLLAKPEFGFMSSMAFPAMYFGFLFFLATALFLPGVFAGYASNFRLPREDFFRACGRNLWRFIRLMIIAAIIMGIVAGILFAASGAIAKKADESTIETLPFTLQMAGLAVIFLVMTTLRVWIDLAEVDVVLDDQRAVRRSLVLAFRHTFSNLTRLLTSYVVATIVAAIFLVGGIVAWMKLIAPENMIGAFLMAQVTLLLLLIPRFWQRGIAVAYWQQKMLAPVVPMQPFEPAPAVARAAPVAPVPEPEPVISTPAEPPVEPQ